MKEIRMKILKIYGVVFLIGTIYFILIKLTGFYIPCGFYRVTGLLCPGCGITALCLALVKFQIVEAVAWNPIVFVLLAMWNVIAVLCFIGKPRFVITKRFLYGSFWVSMGIMIVWGLVRNISVLQIV